MIIKLTIKCYLQFISLKKLFSQNTIYNSFGLKKKHLIFIEKIHSIKNMYTCFFENRTTKTCQSLALIGNLMALVTWKVKSHLKKKFLNTWTSIWFDLIWFVCLEGNKSEAFLISLEYKAF